MPICAWCVRACVYVFVYVSECVLIKVVICGKYKNLNKITKI